MLTEHCVVISTKIDTTIIYLFIYKIRKNKSKETAKPHQTTNYVNYKPRKAAKTAKLSYIIQHANQLI